MCRSLAALSLAIFSLIETDEEGAFMQLVKIDFVSSFNTEVNKVGLVSSSTKTCLLFAGESDEVVFIIFAFVTENETRAFSPIREKIKVFI